MISDKKSRKIKCQRCSNIIIQYNSNHIYCKKCKKIVIRESSRKSSKKRYKTNPNKVKKINKKWLDKNKDRNKQRQKEYREKNKGKIAKQRKENYLKNRDKRIEQMKKNYLKNRDKRLKYSKEQRKNTPNKIKGIDKKCYLKHRDKILNQHKEWDKKNRKHINKHIKQRRKTNKNFAITCRIRGAVWRALTKYTETDKLMSSKKYGIDIKRIIEYLKPFPKNLFNYHNHHKQPLFTFNFINQDGSTNLKEVRKAFKPENHKLITIEKHRKINHRDLGNKYKKQQKMDNNHIFKFQKNLKI